MTVWTASTYPGNNFYVADCGVFTGSWQLPAPFPQVLPADAGEIDYLVSDQSLATITSEANQFSGNCWAGRLSQSVNNPSPLQVGVTRSSYFNGTVTASVPPPAGSHLYVVWYPTGGTLPPPPSYDALTLVPASYAAGGTGPAQDLNVGPPTGPFLRSNTGTVIERGQYQSGYFPYGNPACGVLSDGTHLIVYPRFNGTSSAMAFRAVHLDANLATVLGTLDFAPPAGVWVDWGSCTGLVLRKTVGTTTANRPDGMTFLVMAADGGNPTATLYTWVLDCSGGGAPTILASASETSPISRHIASNIGCQQLWDPATNRAYLVTRGGGGWNLYLTRWDYDTTLLPLYSVQLSTNNDVPLALYPGSTPGELIYFGQNDSGPQYITDDGSSLTLGTADTQPYSASDIVILAGDPTQANPMQVIYERTDDPLDFLAIEAIGDGSSIRQADFLATLAGPVYSWQQNAAGTASAGNPRSLAAYWALDTSTNDYLLRAVGLDYSTAGSPKLDSMLFTPPSPIDPATVTTLQSGSMAIDYHGNTGLVVCCLVDGTSPQYMNVVAVTVYDSTPAPPPISTVNGWGIPL